MTLNFNLVATLAAVVLILVSYAAYRGTTPALKRRSRVFLTASRVASFLAIVFLLMDPRYVVRSERIEPASVVALIDRSESMTLPALGRDAGAAPTRFETARQVAHRIERSVETKGAVYEEVYFSGAALSAPSDTIAADGQGTDIRGALEETFRRYEGRNIAGFVVVSDGVDTERRLVRSPVPPVPVFAVGLGDTNAPEDVRIKEVDYSSIVRVPSRSTITTTLEYSGRLGADGGGAKRVRIRLTENERTVFERDTLFTAGSSELVEEIPVEFRETGKRHFVLDIAVQGFDAEEGNNRREIVIDAEKAGQKILIVDLAPGWELKFLTALVRRDPSFDFDLVSIVGDRAGSTGAKIVAPRDFARRLNEYDALIIASLGREALAPADLSAIESFVRDDGRGLLVLPGPGSLFEQQAAWNRLASLLPVQGIAPMRFNLRYTTVRPGPNAAPHPVTSQLVPVLGQTEWQQRSPLLGFYAPLSPKPGAEILLETEGSRSPALVCGETGNGRVALLAAGPIWRWKFLSEEHSIYDDIVSRLLNFVCRGRNNERFVLRSEKNLYDSGERAMLTAEVFNEKMQPVTGVPVKVEVSKAGVDGDVPLDVLSMGRQGSDNTRFKAALPPLGPGRYRVVGKADLPSGPVASPPLDITVSDVSVEFQRVGQDRANLEMIARQTGGAYTDESGADALAGAMRISQRVTPTSTEVTLRTTVAVFAVILVLLSVEWIVRKRAGMI
jgi:hypothetical protein